MSTRQLVLVLIFVAVVCAVVLFAFNSGMPLR